MQPFDTQLTNSQGARVGVIGVGAMGGYHAECLRDGRVPGLTLGAVCDASTKRLARFAGVPQFTDWRAMLEAGGIEAALVATPHFSHVAICAAAIKAGLHVLVEKPLAVHKADCERLLAVPRKPGQLFGLILNQRTDPVFQAIRDCVRGGRLGRVQPVHWTVTDWFRTDAYYASSPWRASWAGEGGGLLINQACHNLDLYQWIFGMPIRVLGRCGFGRYHAIETEDEVTACFEHANGMSSVFTASTGEAPGMNRMEIIGDCGRLVLDGGHLVLDHNVVPASTVRRESADPFESPATAREAIVLPEGRGLQHLGILQNFGRALHGGEPLIAAAGEGAHAVELANATLLSALTDRMVELPLDSAAYAAKLQSLIDHSPRTRELAQGGVSIPVVAPCSGVLE